MTCLLVLNLSAEAEVDYNNDDDFFSYLLAQEADNNQISNNASTGQNCVPCVEAEVEPSWPYNIKGLVISGEFLWWKVDETGLDYAFSKNFPVLQYVPDAQPESGLVGDEHDASFKWSPGFRIGLGYQFINTPWTLQVEYTRFTSENTNKAHVPDFNGFQNYTATNANGMTFPASTPISILNNTLSGFLETPPEKIRSHLHLKYNLVDINLVKHLFFNSSFILSPYFGAEGVFIDQKWSVDYFSYPFINTIPVTIANTNAYRNKWKFKGGGIDVGVDIDWYWGAGFSCYAKAEVAALYGSHHRSFSMKTLPAYIEVYQYGSVEENRTIQRTQLSAGLEWAYSCGTQAFSLFAGWEFNTLYNLMQTFRFAEADTSSTAGGGNTLPTYSKPRGLDKSDIHLQGVTIGAKWLF